MGTEGTQQYFEISLKDGSTIQCEIKKKETMRELAVRLKETTGVTIGISETVVDGIKFDENTDVLTYFAAKIETDSIDDTAEGYEEQYIDDDDVLKSPSGAEELVGIFCAVPGCGSNKLDFPDLTMFPLPSDRRRCLEWLTAINRQDVVEQSLDEPGRDLCVCANHFLEHQFADKDRHTLTSSAVPALFLADSDNIKLENHDDPTHAEDQVTTVSIEEVKEDEEMEGEADTSHPGALCRLCAQPIVQTPVYIYGDNDKDVAQMINDCLPISVSKTDVLPKQVCEVCYQRVQLQLSFAETCLAAQKQLTDLTKRFLVSDLRRGQRKNKASHDCPLCCNGAMEVVGKPVKQNVDDMEAREADDGGGFEDVTDAGADEVDGQSEDGSVGVIADLTAEEPLDLLYLPEDRNFEFKCEICEEVFASGARCQAHCKLHSSATSNYFPCVVCGLVFNSEHLFSDHFFINHKISKPVSKKPNPRPRLTCQTCNFETNTKKDFIEHPCVNPCQVVKPAPKTYTCSECGLVFTSAARAIAHKNGHESGTSTTPCPQCSLLMSTEKMLLHHVASVHDGIRHECKECGLMFMADNYLVLHSKIHKEGAVQYECSVCGMLFPTLATINVHIQTHAAVTKKEEQKMQCPKCLNFFSERSTLERHLESDHNMMSRMPSLIQYQCKVCGQRIKSSGEVVVHRTTHWKAQDPRKPFVCEYCGEGHQSPNALARHRRYLHPDEHPYVCTLCEVATRTLYEARAHRRTHTNYVPTPAKPQPKIYHCEECPSLFSDKNVFLLHKKHHKTVWFPCDLCDKAFPDKSRQMAHRRQHTGEKPYSCGTCGKRFSQASALYTHALLHTGETPHTCDICNRGFRIKADRDNHRRTHTGEKPYKCQFCPKSFRTGQVYYQHRMIHTDDRRFRCDICGRGFKRSHTLLCHRRIHTGEKPNVCDVCGKGFRQRTDMRKHKMNIHNVSA